VANISIFEGISLISNTRLESERQAQEHDEHDVYYDSHELCSYPSDFLI